MSDLVLDDLPEPADEVQEDVLVEGEAPDAADSEDDGGQGAEGSYTGQGDEGRRSEADRGQAAGVERRSRGSETVRLQRQRAQEAEKRATDLERQIAEIRADQQRAQQAALLAQQEQIDQQRLQSMLPEERADYRARQAEQRMQLQLQAAQLNMQEQMDQASFRSLQTVNPLAKKYASDVERVVMEQKGRGFTVSRETALSYILGQKLLEQQKAGNGAARQQAATQRKRQTTQAGRPASDTRSERGQRGDSIEALEKRLANVSF